LINSTLNFSHKCFRWDSSCSIRTDGHEGAKSRFPQFVCELSFKKKFPRNVYLQNFPMCTSQIENLRTKIWHSLRCTVFTGRQKHQASGTLCRVNLYIGTELNDRRSFMPPSSIYSLHYTENEGSKVQRIQAAVHQTTGRHIAKDWNLHQHSCENLSQVSYGM